MESLQQVCIGVIQGTTHSNQPVLHIRGHVIGAPGADLTLDEACKVSALSQQDMLTRSVNEKATLYRRIL